jgi:hypothetical protein
MGLKGSTQARVAAQMLAALEAVFEEDSLARFLPPALLDQVQAAIKAGRHVGTLPE